MKPKIKTVLKHKKLKRDGAQMLPVKKWIVCYGEIQTIQQRGRVLKWLLVIFTGILLGAFTIFILDGFKVTGFTLPESVLNKLALLTIGQVAGLAVIAFRFLFH